MAWTAPATFTDGSVLTAAQLNTNLRDNLNETGPAKATAAGRIFVTTGANALAERVISTDYVATSEATTSTSYVNLTTTGPSVTATTGVRALVAVSSRLQNSVASGASFMAADVSGATTDAANDNRALMFRSPATNDTGRYTYLHMFDALTAGSNVFTAKYHVGSGTGTFQERRITVIAL